WTDVAPPDRQQVVEQLAALSRANYEKIKTWKGSYAYRQRQYLDEEFVAQLPTGKPGARGKSQPLIQEVDAVLKFAIDVASDAIYRDLEAGSIRFYKVGTDEEVKISNVGAAEGRSIIAADVYLTFNPKERATSAFLPNHPEAQHKRRANRFPAHEAQM